jgi:hypothetical protein
MVLGYIQNCRTQYIVLVCRFFGIEGRGGRGGAPGSIFGCSVSGASTGMENIIEKLGVKIKIFGVKGVRLVWGWFAL